MSPSLISRRPGWDSRSSTKPGKRWPTLPSDSRRASRWRATRLRVAEAALAAHQAERAAEQFRLVAGAVGCNGSSLASPPELGSNDPAGPALRIRALTGLGKALTRTGQAGRRGHGLRHGARAGSRRSDRPGGRPGPGSRLRGRQANRCRPQVVFAWFWKSLRNRTRHRKPRWPRPGLFARAGRTRSGSRCIRSPGRRPARSRFTRRQPA